MQSEYNSADSAVKLQSLQADGTDYKNNNLTYKSRFYVN